jgi:hypothetical protein
MNMIAISEGPATSCDNSMIELTATRTTVWSTEARTTVRVFAESIGDLPACHVADGRTDAEGKKHDGHQGPGKPRSFNSNGCDVRINCKASKAAWSAKLEADPDGG